MLMILGLQSYSFGLSLGDLLNVELQQRTIISRRVKNYRSELDAEIVHSNINKNVLTNDSLLRYLIAGINNKGYWRLSHAKLQLGDVFNCLINIHLHSDFIFLYGQWLGYTKMREDSLIPSNTNVVYSGILSTMYDTTIYKIGSHTPSLHVGSTHIGTLARLIMVHLVGRRNLSIIQNRNHSLQRIIYR